ncbi:sigma-54-dependent transcriptional regulator [Gracilimonas mengyeensis]|uniref:DNA-binding transcriptional response regulator, NtrC family, contains REC, AAA-type ATPase, and a Fis-type DNA-binding domains n=1 Tax=Gracilimonas mengyeensis TaxID=1302730 RepID=A0A521AAP7_9BACT|nr:sigma-54 dependent transcriptional regulator [Gracilimonas mengyeensis]SMO31883.1 DNA-binding transcriptional response regulator, NtrC family, contains REC, AAA-type ATPase, and a Fis-type DNA-binding domains [Gracilimonas mengyeensis]
MSEKKAHILVTDDEKSIRNTLKEILEFEDYLVSAVESGQAALDFIEKNDIDLMFLDIKMQGMDGLETLEKLREDGYGFPVIMISGHGTIEIAVEATKMGAYDFLEKPPDLNRLLIAVRNALSQQNLQKEYKQIKKKLPKIQEIIGESKAIEEIKTMIEKVAPTHSRVLITGENGTGKELVARWIHEKSPRSAGPFVEVNCAAIPSDLLESELFGHEKGAFTGASEQRIGKFEQADGGSLFLDEIGDMSLEAQAKVLRALQESIITRVGGNESIKVDVRILAATNKDLEEEISEGNFREDLFHRISVIPIEVPPLRERQKDIPLIAQACLQNLKERDISFSSISFSNDGLKALQQKEWSGNVRELQNAVERLGILATGEEITEETVQNVLKSRDLKAEDLGNLADETEDFQDFKETAERLFLVKQLEKNDWNISQTAETIGIQRSHMYNKMKKYNIER